MYENKVERNRVAVSSDNPSVVDIVAFELTDSRDNPDAPGFPAIYDNVIAFNDFRGTVQQIAVTPPELADYNIFSRNLGENRGHGMRPSLLGPK